jgi:alkylation response protein AidB-like acyl-CoA dehydrogenase
VSREIWQELGKMGFLGISLPAEKGGVGGTFLDEAIVLEEQVLFIIYPMLSNY